MEFPFLGIHNRLGMIMTQNIRVEKNCKKQNKKK